MQTAVAIQQYRLIGYPPPLISTPQCGNVCGMKTIYIVTVTETTSGNHFDEKFATFERAKKYAAFVNEGKNLTATISRQQFR
jgi:hypothetical protein